MSDEVLRDLRGWLLNIGAAGAIAAIAVCFLAPIGVILWASWKLGHYHSIPYKALGVVLLLIVVWAICGLVYHVLGLFVDDEE